MKFDIIYPTSGYWGFSSEFSAYLHSHLYILFSLQQVNYKNTGIVTLHKKATIHQATTMLAISENVAHMLSILFN